MDETKRQDGPHAELAISLVRFSAEFVPALLPPTDDVPQDLWRWWNVAFLGAGMRLLRAIVALTERDPVLGGCHIRAVRSDARSPEDRTRTRPSPTVSLTLRLDRATASAEATRTAVGDKPEASPTNVGGGGQA
jgi:hypothetical protein